MASPDYSDWIGKRYERSEIIVDRMIAQYRAMLGPWLAEAPVPPGLHWCLCPDALTADQLGRDGHPRTGIFLPTLPLPRRMWAGGTLHFRGDFHPGDAVTRRSGVDSVTFKDGTTGPLGFIALRHEYLVSGELVLDEVQTIVYREDPAPGAVTAPPAAPDLGRARDRIDLTPDPVLLFRFSALSFNGHRIHYDEPYATGIEGYAGLVVHGPLQAALMLNLAARVMGQMPAHFTYRGVSPLTVSQPISVEAYDAAEGLGLRVRIAGGPVTMTGAAKA